MEEIWKDIEGYEGLYQISNLGRVKSLKRKRRPQEKLLSIQQFPNQYYFINLCRNGKNKSCLVHRLTANAFVRSRFKKQIVNHKNGIKTDNRVENLEWCTYIENIRHAKKIGLIKNKF